MTKHLPRLDSLRGIAAVLVGGFHSGLVGGPIFLGQDLSWYLGFLFDGRTAVCIFFVLSGLVLGMSLRREGAVTPVNYFRFCGRRFFRLFPAYFISAFFYLALFLVLKSLVSRGQPIGYGLCNFYTHHLFPSRLELAENFCFLSQFLNVPSWTLKVEAQAAFILPFLHALSLRFRGKGQIFLLVLLIAWSFLTKDGSTRIHLYLFYLGYLIPQLLEVLRAPRFEKLLTHGTWLLVLAISLLAISHPFAGPILAARLGVLLAGLGSMLLLTTVLLFPSHPGLSVLDHRPIKYLGRISYSFYLFSWLCIDLMQRAFYSTLGKIWTESLVDWAIVFLVSTLLCVIVSSCSFYLIERPSIRLGNYLLRPSETKIQPA